MECQMTIISVDTEVPPLCITNELTSLSYSHLWGTDQRTVPDPPFSSGSQRASRELIISIANQAGPLFESPARLL